MKNVMFKKLNFLGMMFFLFLWENFLVILVVVFKKLCYIKVNWREIFGVLLVEIIFMEFEIVRIGVGKCFEILIDYCI